MISLIIPFFNESKRLDRLEDGLNQYRNRNQLIQEIIFVNDGSSDDTLLHLQKFQKQFPENNIQVIQIETNCGKGNALQAGILQAQHNWVLCNDADLSYRLEQIDEWYETELLDLNKNETIYFGKRIIKDKKSKFFVHRIIIGKIFYLLIRLILGINIQDTQCGFKLYPTAIAKEVFKDLQEKRFAFDLEIIYKLIQQNYTIKTLPVHCIDIEGSKVNLLKDSWNMFWALFRIRKLKR